MKEEILARYRANIHERYDMPDLGDLKAVTYTDPVSQFKKALQTSGGQVKEISEVEDLNTLISSLFPDAKEIASNLPEVSIATRNPDTAENASALNGTDVGIVRGMFGVAENGCVWIPQQMKQKAVMFISENLVILLPRDQIVNNMHEAYRRLQSGDANSGIEQFCDYGYGTFISGPSKTADIAQVLVMGAQAARSVTVVLIP
ncbi:MAG: LUD domain-containing protein [Prevotella sp.]|nr:LUD domain-containing protein [Prevotella sp.]